MTSIAQGNALDIRHLRIMRPVRAALIFHCFYSCPYRAHGLCLSVTQGVALGYGDIGLSARIIWVLTHSHRLPLIYKDKYDHILILFILYHKVMTATFSTNDIRDIVDIHDILPL